MHVADLPGGQHMSVIFLSAPPIHHLGPAPISVSEPLRHRLRADVESRQEQRLRRNRDVPAESVTAAFDRSPAVAFSPAMQPPYATVKEYTALWVHRTMVYNMLYGLTSLNQCESTTPG